MIKMKKTIFLCIAILAFISCQDNYELNTDFSVPTELHAPSSIQLNVSSTELVSLSWTGGDASDGGIVLYEVLFDKAGGDFSEPLAKMKSDRERCQTCRLHMEPSIPLQEKQAFIPRKQENYLDGACLQRRSCENNDKVGSIQVTRGEGIDNIPTKLYLYGSATENNGQGGTHSVK